MVSSYIIKKNKMFRFFNYVQQILQSRKLHLIEFTKQMYSLELNFNYAIKKSLKS